VVEGSLTTTAAAIWLVLGAFTYLAARRTRTPAPSVRFAHLFLPVAGLAAAACLPAPPPSPRFVLPTLAPELASALRVGEPLLRGGVTSVSAEVMNASGDITRAPDFSLNLHLDGLPPDHVAAAQWKSVEITAPDGRKRLLQSGGMLTWMGAQTDRSDVLNVAQVVLLRPEDTAFSLTPCRLDGILTVEVRRKHRVVMPLRAGEVVNKSGAQVMLTEVAPPLFDWEGNLPWFTFSTVMDDLLQRPSLWLENRTAPERRLHLDGGAGGGGGWLILHAWNRWQVRPSSSAVPLEASGFINDAKEGRLDRWQIGMSWYEAVGRVELPVSLDHVVVPRIRGDGRKPEDICDGLRIVPGASADEIRRAVKYALTLADLFPPARGRNHDDDPLLRSVVRLLEEVPREQRDVLLRIAEEDMPEHPDFIRPFDTPLRKRIAALLEAEDIPALRQKPKLFRCFRFELAERRLIPYDETHDPELPDRTDAELLRRWEESRSQLSPSIVSLEIAARRGLSWVPPAIGEVARIRARSPEAGDVIKFMSAISDCPANQEAAIPWLLENAARLTWDATARRWVLPGRK
jgi:hypothetical protein